MDSTVLIALIVVVGIVIVVWMLRDRLTAITARGSQNEIEVKAEAAPDASPPANAPRAGVSITHTKSIGNTKIEIARDDVNMDDNLLTGKTDIRVKADPKKPRR